MKTREYLLVGISVLALTSCAALGLYPSAKHEFDEGLGLFNRGQYAKAITHFNKAIELDAEYGEAYLYLGRSYLNLGRWFDAITPLRTAMRLAPVETRKEALNLLVDALFGAGVESLKSGNFESSIDYFREVLELQPGSERVKSRLFDAFMGFGVQSLSEGNPAVAINAFSEALQLSPNNLNAYLSLAKAFFKSGDFMKSLQTIQDILRMDPGNLDALSLLNELKDQ